MTPYKMPKKAAIIRTKKQEPQNEPMPLIEKLSASDMTYREIQAYNMGAEEEFRFCKSWLPVHDKQIRKSEWRRIFKAMHITRKQMLELPLDIRQDILEQQVNNYLENISDEEKLEDLRKLD